MSPSYTRDYPFVMARGEGAVVEDVDGNRFLDCAAGIAVNSTGVSHPDVVAAIIEQAQKFLHMSGTDFYYEPQVRLAEELAAIAPIEGRRPDVLRQLGDRSHRSGDQARAVFHEAPERDRVSRRVSRPNAGIAVADSEQDDPAPRIRSDDAGVYPRRIPNCYRFQRAARLMRGGVPGLHRGSDHRAPRRRPTRSAAIIVEPIQGEGGYIVPPPAFLQRLRELTTQARHPAGRGRGAVRHGPDREDVRARAFRREAPTSSTSRRASRPACRWA